MFRCDCCGECCRNLDKSELYSELHNGDGICRYLKDNLCSIYDNRPLLCRIDESYEKYFSKIIDIDVYYKLNEEICIKLKNKEE